MTLVFYHVPQSTSSITEAVLAELGIPVEKKVLSISAGDTNKPEFLTLNPNGRVPVVVHDSAVLWESAAITMYVGETFGVESNLYPKPGGTRGLAMKWIVWSNVALAAAASRLASSFPPEVEGAVLEESKDFVPADKRHGGDKARRDIAECFRVLDGELNGKMFLLGEEYSLADTHVQAIVGWASAMAGSLKDYVHVGSWLQRCSQRPALAKLMG